MKRVLVLGLGFFLLSGETCASRKENIKIRVSGVSKSTKGQGPVQCCDNGINRGTIAGAEQALRKHYGYASVDVQDTCAEEPHPIFALDRSEIERFQSQTGAYVGNPRQEILLNDITLETEKVKVSGSQDNPDFADFGDLTQGKARFVSAWIGVVTPAGDAEILNTTVCPEFTETISAGDESVLYDRVSTCLKLLEAQINLREGSQYAAPGRALREALLGLMGQDVKIAFGGEMYCEGDFYIEYEGRAIVNAEVNVKGAF